MRWKIAQFFESIWWKYYLKNKDTKQYLDWKIKYWNDFLIKIRLEKESLDDKNILDSGCGPAGIFIVISNARVTALDPLLNFYQNKICHFNSNWYKNVAFSPLSIEQYQEKEKFDFIFCLNAINHVENINLAIENLIYSLKNDGKMIITIDCHKYTFLKSLFSFFQGDVLHPHQYTLDEYKTLFFKYGLNIENEFLLKNGLIFDYYSLALHHA